MSGCVPDDGGVLGAHLLHDQPQPVRPRQRPEEEGRAAACSSARASRAAGSVSVARTDLRGARCRRAEAATGRRRSRVVDIGSNSIRLVVYERLCRAPIALFNEKSVCALGKGLATTGRLGREEMDSALHALRRFAHIAEALRAGEIEYVATEAVRRAENGERVPGRGRARHRPPGRGPLRPRRGARRGDGRRLQLLPPDGVVGDLGGGSVDLSVVTPTGRAHLMAACRSARCRSRACCSTATRRPPSVIDERLASVPWLAGAAAGPQLLRRRRRLARARRGSGWR